MAHAEQFTAGFGNHGIYWPGLSLNPRGTDTLAISDASELRAMAKVIGDLCSGVGQARRVIIEYLGRHEN